MSKSVTLLSALVERQENGMVTFMANGEPHAAAIVHAVAGNWPRLAGRPEIDVMKTLYESIDKRVTLIGKGENFLGAPAIWAVEGRIFPGSSGNLAILPKGSRKRGLRLRPSEIVDVLDGFDAGAAQALALQAKAALPELKPLTLERLQELPPIEFGVSPDATLAVFGSYRLPDAEATDCVWLLHSYDPEGIVEGFLLIRPEHGVSEHGSVCSDVLLRLPVGEVVGFEPISFAAGVELTDLDYDEAWQRLGFGQAAA
jgi:hypothetical protein